MTNNCKIKTIDELANELKELRKKNRRIVLCHGVFDLLHIGHIRYLEQASGMGDVLVVTLTPDHYVDKGPHRPAFTETLRVEAVASLNCVDYVTINKWPTAEETLRFLRPRIYVKGSDFKNAASDPTGKLAREEAVVKEIGAEMAFTEDIVFSSTNLINRFFSNFPEDIQKYLNFFKARYRLKDVLELLDQMSSLNVIVIGDTILDDYHYCHTLGVSSKDPALALHYDSNDLFAGGALAVANHVANFAQKVILVTVLGEKDSYEDFIRSKLQSNISPYFVFQDDAPTIIKRRFVEGYSINKLFEIYIMDDSGLSAQKDAILRDMLGSEIPNCDLVVAADFGHGAISPDTRNILMEKSPFLSVNTQANAGNKGFHTISCYEHADYVSLAEGEIHLEFRDMTGDIRPMMDILTERLQCRDIAITLGRKGSLLRNQDGTFIEVPAFVQKVIDRVGAGDAFFSVSSMAAFLGAPPELIGFLGNVVGGLAAEILGNQKAIEKMSVQKYVTSLLK